MNEYRDGDSYYLPPRDVAAPYSDSHPEQSHDDGQYDMYNDGYSSYRSDRYTRHTNPESEYTYGGGYEPYYENRRYDSRGSAQRGQSRGSYERIPLPQRRPQEAYRRSAPQSRPQYRPTVHRVPPRRQRKKSYAGLILLLILVLAVLAALNTAIFYTGNILKQIDYHTDQPLQSASSPEITVSAADILSGVPDEGMTGTELDVINGASRYHKLMAGYYPSKSLYSEDGVTNILFMVRDTAEDSCGDIFALFSINTEKRRICICSIAPETAIAYTGLDAPIRLQCAPSMGGSELTVNTLHSLLGIRIDRWITVDRQGFAQIIDDMGGIELELSMAEADAINKCAGMFAGGGYAISTMPLDGMQSLNCAMFAGAPDDGRITERRAAMTHSAAEKLLAGGLKTLLLACRDGAPHSSTNLSKGQILSLFSVYNELRDYSIITDAVPADGNYEQLTVGGKAVLFADTAAMHERLVNLIYK